MVEIVPMSKDQILVERVANMIPHGIGFMSKRRVVAEKIIFVCQEHFYNEYLSDIKKD